MKITCYLDFTREKITVVAKSEMVRHFIGAYIINRTLHGRLKIRNFSTRVEKYFRSFAALTRELFFNTRRALIAGHAHKISALRSRMAP